MTATVRTHVLRASVLLLCVVALNFFLPRMLPGSPLSSGAALETVLLPSEPLADLRAMYGLDRPMFRQFSDYLSDLAGGDLGRSVATHQPVVRMIAVRLPWTLLLVGAAILSSGVLGGWLATAAVWSRRKAVRAVAAAVIVAGALPEFLVAMVLIVVLSSRLRIFPAGGALTPFLAAADANAWRSLADVAWHAALPVLTLTLTLLPAFFLLFRNALAVVAAEPYLLVARGKGLAQRNILAHAWRNALPGVLTMAGLRLAFAVTGAAVIERLFAYPGMGMLLFEAVARRDYPVLQGVFLVSSAAVIMMSLALELLAVRMDPRLREEPA